MWCYCGGPDLLDAITGLRNVMEGDIGELLAGRSTVEELEIEIDCREMTDEEVEAIPEV